MRLSFFYRNVVDLRPDLRVQGVIPKPLRTFFVYLREDGNRLVQALDELPGPAAELEVTEGTRDAIPGAMRYRLVVRNVGYGIAREMRTWIVDDSGKRISSLAVYNLGLVPDDSTTMRVTVDTEIARNLDVIHWTLKWKDEEGEHQR
jgi:hypothetical protein